ncbi:MAG: hypothetical protein M9909_05470 [Thermomicrobiales bacterium]|nr:hypothetical protein [Thermomicrobiales bacterium]
MGLGHLVITGAQTNASCPRYNLPLRGGRLRCVTLVEDAHTTEDIVWNEYDLKAKSMIDDLNLTLSFID